LANIVKKNPANHDYLRALPSVDALLKTDTARALLDEVGSSKLTSLARSVTADLRRELITDSSRWESDNGLKTQLLAEAELRLRALHHLQKSSGVRRVINATGVVLHTNLGRAPLSAAAREAIIEAAGYCSLEYDTITGERGLRGARAEHLLVDLTGAEAALIVNNCAAAALLVLSTFASGGETIVSRGELVEIGGDFRVPDVMAQSGTRMIEVGTTNRTRLSDYNKAISEGTRVVMRVHTSNYRIVGFTKTPSLAELAGLTRTSKLLLYEDAGSGALIDLTDYGIEGEPVIRKSIDEGVDIVTFSGDKLLGGPQAGLIVGRADLIEKMRQKPLYRALRADKLRLAALEATLESYSRGELMPSLAMIASPAKQILSRSQAFADRLNSSLGDGVKLDLIQEQSVVGGGAAPTSPLPTTLITLKHPSLGAEEIAARLRRCTPPVVARILDNSVALDLRTVAPAEEPEIESAIVSLAG
jgi:L-seryl-tRNA(Ser) seleniumtransferase